MTNGIFSRLNLHKEMFQLSGLIAGPLHYKSDTLAFELSWHSLQEIFFQPLDCCLADFNDMLDKSSFYRTVPLY